MKKVFLLVGLCITAVLLLFASCEKHCMGKRPKEVKPIDWNNYNDVHTVFWNYYTFCSKVKQEDEGKEIMVSGWILQSPLVDGLYLLNDISQASIRPIPRTHLPILILRNPTEILQKLDTCDLTKKCYIKGELLFNCLETMSRVCESEAAVELIVYNASDIYFDFNSEYTHIRSNMHKLCINISLT